MTDIDSGIGFAIALKIGIFIENINRRVDRLYPHIESSLMMHNLYETFSPEDNRNRFNENHKKLVNHIKIEVGEINKQIRSGNRLLNLLKFGKQIQLVDFISIKAAIDERFSDVFKEDRSQEVSNQNLKLKLSSLISKTSKSIFDLTIYAKEKETFDGLKKINKKYRDGIEEAIDIYSFGHRNTSLFILGKTLELVLNDSIKKQVKEKETKRIILSKTKYISKIGILKESRFIDERLFHELNTIRIDRDDTGHPTKRKCTTEECKNTISRVILIISQLERKLI